MKYTTVIVGDLGNNCYLVKDDAGRGFIVDPGSELDKIKEAVSAFGLTPLAVLLTHGHYDHMNEAHYFQAQGIPVYVHSDDEVKLHTYKGMSLWAGVSHNGIRADVTLSGGEALKFGDLRVEVIHTPGHSAGGVCYKCGNLLFTGDTVFKRDYGRYDFYDGDFKTLKNMIVNKLFNLNGEYEVLPGHGDASTLSYEKKFNPILMDTGTD
ncbi:MAG: MBL fold metallo-hydrolase [Clostridiaceae bacterium]|jgi:glyoxylase-like metal-dependent hydrolase (beta-lactamase superfamily II)|nr:MBL fold metallo-hydrolase [Clostridiaceae bacterium]